MKKADIIKRITEIVSSNPDNRIDLTYPVETGTYKQVVYKTEKGSIHIISYPIQYSHPIRELSKYSLSDILYEIGDEDDMKQVRDFVNPKLYNMLK